MRFTVCTLFPNLIETYLSEGLLARARASGILEVETRDMRRFAGNRTNRVDDTPYGGGPGMVIRVDVAAQALDEVHAEAEPPDEVILLSPSGRPLDQDLVSDLATRRHVCLLSGRYEGFDARVESLVTREVSVGDFILMGGELPALCLIEAVTRLLPGALGAEASHAEDSFTDSLLDHPSYTRPVEYRGLSVPEVLLSGHHGEVAVWRRRQALRRTFERRPDLLASANLTNEERQLVDAWHLEYEEQSGLDEEATG